MSGIVRCALYFGKPVAVACDARCDKAWGIQNRPHRQLSEHVDDYVWLSDEELGEAPADPGTYEGGHGKPEFSDQRMNKWCVRECERSAMVGLHEQRFIELPDLSNPSPNMRQPPTQVPDTERGAE